MIRYILINNFATIESTQIEFENGLNIITGETGSGKSIVIEAISLALGARADSSFVRTGSQKAIIQLIAELDNEEFIITREISTSGKNICKINGRLATLGEVAELANRIADIHGQYDNRLLMDNKNHLLLVDSYGTKEISPIKSGFTKAYSNYKQSKKELDALLETDRDNRQKEDFLRFELEEINSVNPDPIEDYNLSERISILENSEKIYYAIDNASSILSRVDSNILSSLGKLQNDLASVSEYSDEISELYTTVTDTFYSLDDVNSKLGALQEGITFNPGEIDTLINRLDKIENLKKKYGNSIEEILLHKEKVQKELTQLDNFDVMKEELTIRSKKDLLSLKKFADKLTELRTKYAEKLSKTIEKEMHELNFPDAKFSINVTHAPAINSTGGDDAEILISTNKGEPLKPLTKTASGGEISRIMLAIKNITGGQDKVPTMIFDEIDTGISGITASAVGKKLRQVANQHQIICITHLPQIAACGDFNYKIYKESNDDSTFTNVDKLDNKETVYEIARLLGGEIITNITRESAKELIENSRK